MEPLKPLADGQNKLLAPIDVALDWFERIAVLALYVFLFLRILQPVLSSGDQTMAFLTGVPFLISEGPVVVFILLRRSARETSHRWTDWFAAIVATCAPLLVVGSTTHPPVPIIMIGLSIWGAGLTMQVHAKFSLRRSFGVVPAHRGLVTDGPYKYVRHPMYAGYALNHIGLLMMNPCWRNLACYVVAETFQIKRIFDEEHILSADEEYRKYKEKVRFRVIPGLF